MAGLLVSGIVSIKSVVVLVALAAAAGTFVQYGEAVVPDPGSADETPAPAPAFPATVNLTAATSTIFRLPDAIHRPFNHSEQTRAIVPVRAVYSELQVPRLGPVMATPISGCTAAFTLTEAKGAVVDLAVVLPCAPEQDVVIRHGFLEFSAQTDAAGQVNVSVPALAENATFSVLVDNLEHASASLPVASVRDYDRVVLQWRGRDNLQLHAFERGAMIGDPGHIWSASVPDVTGQRGFVQRFGVVRATFPFFAEIYTQPVQSADTATTLQIGVALTAENCGRGIVAATHHVSAGSQPVQQEVSLILPGCDAVGTIMMVDGHFQEGVADRR